MGGCLGGDGRSVGGGGAAEVGRVGVLGGGGRLVATFSYPLRTDIAD